MNAAAIDLGTNSIKILIVRRDKDGQMHVLFRHRAVVRLGEGTFSKNSKDNKLSKQVQDRTLKVFQSYAKFLEAYKVDVVRATGTSALREAQNGPDFVKQVREKTGIALEVLPGPEEARLIVKGVASEYPLPRKPVLFIDIGGGSCEITLTRKSKIEKFTSLPLGAVRLTEFYLPNSKATPQELKKLDQHVLKILKANWPSSEKYPLAFGSAGTIRALGRMISKTELTEDDRLITSKQLERAMNKICKLNKKGIAALPGVDAKRAEILTAGTRVLWQVFNYFKIKELKVSQRGLREGLLIDLFEKPQKPTYTPSEDGVSKEFIALVARKYNSNQNHCQQVWRLVSQLFDELSPVHLLNSNTKRILRVATLLHDVGHFIGESSHHKHSYYILKNTDFPQLSEKEKELVAILARYHRKSPPKDDHEGYKDLNAEDKKLVNSLASILRIADALDASHNQSVKWLKCVWGPGTVRIGVELKEGAKLNQEVIKDKSKLFELIHKVQLSVVYMEQLKIANNQKQSLISLK
ncbi:MAG: Ppx/GppA family phosphatase [Oligoflexia bacterium]|nr:Ppx/GppA family phosphatase [Oligoflexia bacterium]